MHARVQHLFMPILRCCPEVIMKCCPDADLQGIYIFAAQVLYTPAHSEDCHAAAEGQVSRGSGATQI